MKRPPLPDSTEQAIHEAWTAGKGVVETSKELEGLATQRQVQARFNRFNQEAQALPVEAQADPLCAMLVDPSLSSESKETVLMRLMELQLTRLHFASANPRQVKMDLRAERLLGERLESLLKALRDKPYEVLDAQ